MGEDTGVNYRVMKTSSVAVMHALILIVSAVMTKQEPAAPPVMIVVETYVCRRV